MTLSSESAARLDPRVDASTDVEPSIDIDTIHRQLRTLARDRAELDFEVSPDTYHAGSAREVPG